MPSDAARLTSESARACVRQNQLVDQGKSWTWRSKHLRQKDGYAHAVDLIATGDLDLDGDIDATDRSLIWAPDIYRLIADAMCEAAADLGIQIRWGGDWDCDGDTGDENHFDGPHFELV